MAKPRNTPARKDGEIIEKVKDVLAKDAKKSTNVRKPTTGCVVKVVVNSTKKKLEANVKAINNTGSVIVPSGTTLDMSEKVRKRKVDTHSEARFPCPTHRSLDNIQRELYQVSRVSTADSLTQLGQTDFYLSCVQSLYEFEY